jgi:hypothetical protein
VKKKKVYVLMVSRVFPKSHPRAGEETFFQQKIYASMHPNLCAVGTPENPIKYPIKILLRPEPKIHTIRGSYDLWKKRADKINAGEAVLSLRQWSGEPYKSKQKEFLQLEKVGIQHAKILTGSIAPGFPKGTATFIDGDARNIHEVAKNDGLSVDDFCKWFKKDFEGCVIHFTQNFRYGND